MAEKQWTVHVVSHSHWDREWFLPFEQHRMRLVDLIDQLLDLFDKDQFSSFYLDGQTIVLDDYLQIRPQNEQRLRARIQEGRLVIGPWYVLQDEFLTCGESNVRNLLTGVREARKFGPVSMLGYFPDAFGNAGQMPQLLADAGMKAVLFGRGVKPVGFDNEVLDAGEYESCFSEMQWASPDGTSLFGVLFANWYNNGNEIPVAEADARAYWDDRLPKAQKFASTSQLLFLNGCDHQPVQVDVDRAIETANRLYTNVRFLHSNYEDFLRAAQEELAQNNTQLSTVTGELISQETDGWTTLVNTSSCRVYLKQQNQKNETLLARQAEPMAAAGALLGVEYPHDFLDYAWKTLMQNHPHDSICGCVADEVNREVATRFEKSIAVGEELVARAGGALMDKIAWPDFGQGAVPFAVFNPSGKCRKAVTCITLDIERLYTGQYDENYRTLRQKPLGCWKVVDESGAAVPCVVEDAGAGFGYDLPRDKFRQPCMAKRAKVTLQAQVPAMGLRCYALVPAQEPAAGSLVVPGNGMENDAIKAWVEPDGTLSLLHKSTGREYRGLGYLEDTGDIGNEYIYYQPPGEKSILSRGGQAKIELLEDTPVRAAYRATVTMQIPVSAQDSLREETAACIHFSDRTTQRKKQTLPLTVQVEYSLEKEGKGVGVHVSYNNQMKDHRLRMVFPTGLEASTHLVDSVFEAVRRPNRPSAAWQNPSNCQHQQCFTSVDDGKAGLLVANRGLYEYEVLPDDANAVAVTLLRAVGEIGDWGDFPTPEAQCLGQQYADLLLVPHVGNAIASGACELAYQFQGDMPVFQKDLWGRAPHDTIENKLPAKCGLLSYEGEGITLTGCKLADQGQDLILRFVNLADTAGCLRLSPHFPVAAAYQSDVLEGEGQALQQTGGAYCIEAGPHKIITLRLTAAAL